MQRSLERRLKLHDWRIRQDKRSSSLILGRCPLLNLPVGSSLIAAVPLRHPRSRTEDRQCLRICFERVGLDEDPIFISWILITAVPVVLRGN